MPVSQNYSLSWLTFTLKSADTLKRYDYDGSFFEPLSVLSLEASVTWINPESFARALLQTGINMGMMSTLLWHKYKEEVKTQKDRIDQRWVKMLKCLPDGSSHIKNLVSLALSIPVSNVYYERVLVS